VTTTWHADDVLLTDPTRHAAYLCLTVAASDHAGVAALPVAALAHQLGLRNECDPGGNHPPEAIAFLRGLDATPADIDDNGVLRADAVVHAASDDARTVTTFCTELRRMLTERVEVRTLGGVVRPMSYTGTAMHNYAYAHRVVQ
jgi:hypothetical protein